MISWHWFDGKGWTEPCVCLAACEGDVGKELIVNISIGLIWKAFRTRYRATTPWQRFKPATSTSRYCIGNLGQKCSTSKLYSPVIKHRLLENPLFLDDFSIETTIYKGISAAMFDYQRATMSFGLVSGLFFFWGGENEKNRAPARWAFALVVWVA